MAQMEHRKRDIQNSMKLTCKCKFRLDAGVCNNKQPQNKDKRRWECKELIYKGRSNKEFIWNPSICERECDKSCNVGEYLDYENC